MTAPSIAAPEVSPKPYRALSAGRVVMSAALIGLCLNPAYVLFVSWIDIEASLDLRQTIVIMGLIWTAPLAILGMLCMKPIVERIVRDRYPATRRTLRDLTIALVLVPAGIVGVLTQAIAGMMLTDNVRIFQLSEDDS